MLPPLPGVDPSFLPILQLLRHAGQLAVDALPEVTRLSVQLVQQLVELLPLPRALLPTHEAVILILSPQAVSIVVGAAVKRLRSCSFAAWHSAS